MKTDYRDRLIRQEKISKKFVIDGSKGRFAKKVVSTDHLKQTKKMDHTKKINRRVGSERLIQKKPPGKLSRETTGKTLGNPREGDSKETATLETSKVIGRSGKNAGKAAKRVTKGTFQSVKKGKELLEKKAKPSEVLVTAGRGAKKGTINTSKAAKNVVFNEIHQFKGDPEAEGITEATQLKETVQTGRAAISSMKSSSQAVKKVGKAAVKGTKTGTQTLKQGGKQVNKIGKASYKATQRVAEVTIHKAQQLLSKEAAKVLVTKLIVPLVSVVLVFSLMTMLVSSFGLMAVGTDDCDTSTNYDNIPTKDMEANAKAIAAVIKKEVPESTSQGIAGALGAMQFESQLNPNAVNKSSGATGIAQWLGSRLTALKDFAAKKGKQETDLGVQVSYLLSELNSSYYLSSKKILSMTNVHDACKEWVMKFEGLSQDPGQWYLSQRDAYADHWFAALGNDPITEGTFGNGSDGELSGLACDDGNSGDILAVAKSWLGWFHYPHPDTHSVAQVGGDALHPEKEGITDCSGYVWLVLNKAGYKVPPSMGWYTGSMASDAKTSHQYFKQVSQSEAHAGDVVIVNVGAGVGGSGHTGILTEKWRGKDTKIIQEGGSGDRVNIDAFGSSFMSLLDGGDVVLVRAIKK